MYLCISALKPSGPLTTTLISAQLAHQHSLPPPAPQPSTSHTSRERHQTGALPSAICHINLAVSGRSTLLTAPATSPVCSAHLQSGQKLASSPSQSRQLPRRRCAPEPQTIYDDPLEAIQNCRIHPDNLLAIQQFNHLSAHRLQPNATTKPPLPPVTKAQPCFGKARAEPLAANNHTTDIFASVRLCRLPILICPRQKSHLHLRSRRSQTLRRLQSPLFPLPTTNKA